MITLAKEVIDSASGQQSLEVMDVSVRRKRPLARSWIHSNRYSISTGASKRSVHQSSHCRSGRRRWQGFLASLGDGRVVAVRQKNMLATSFHPEITGETRVHQYFLQMISGDK
jgi:pyridoxal 5'-phosphate synthase pdxT subunit